MVEIFYCLVLLAIAYGLIRLAISFASVMFSGLFILLAACCVVAGCRLVFC